MEWIEYDHFSDDFSCKNVAAAMIFWLRCDDVMTFDNLRTDYKTTNNKRNYVETGTHIKANI